MEWFVDYLYLRLQDFFFYLNWTFSSSSSPVPIVFGLVIGTFLVISLVRYLNRIF